jgi:hypothetical protein
LTSSVFRDRSGILVNGATCGPQAEHGKKKASKRFRAKHFLKHQKLGFSKIETLAGVCIRIRLRGTRRENKDMYCVVALGSYTRYGYAFPSRTITTEPNLTKDGWRKIELRTRSQSSGVSPQVSDFRRQTSDTKDEAPRTRHHEPSTAVSF